MISALSRSLTVAGSQGNQGEPTENMQAPHRETMVSVCCLYPNKHSFLLFMLIQEHLWSPTWSWWWHVAFLLSLRSSRSASTLAWGPFTRLPGSVPCLKVRDDQMILCFWEKQLSDCDFHRCRPVRCYHVLHFFHVLQHCPLLGPFLYVQLIWSEPTLDVLQQYLEFNKLFYWISQ